MAGASNANQMSSILFGSCEMSHYHIDSGRKNTQAEKWKNLFVWVCDLSYNDAIWEPKPCDLSPARGGLEHLIMLGPMKTVFFFLPKIQFFHFNSLGVFFPSLMLPLENLCGVFVISHIFTSFVSTSRCRSNTAPSPDAVKSFGNCSGLYFQG